MLECQNALVDLDDRLSENCPVEVLQRTHNSGSMTVDVVLFGVPQTGQFLLSLNLNNVLFGEPHLDLLTLIFGQFSLRRSSSGKYTVTFQHRVLLTRQQRAKFVFLCKKKKEETFYDDSPFFSSIQPNSS